MMTQQKIRFQGGILSPSLVYRFLWIQSAYLLPLNKIKKKKKKVVSLDAGLENLKDFNWLWEIL